MIEPKQVTNVSVFLSEIKCLLDKKPCDEFMYPIEEKDVNSELKSEDKKLYSYYSVYYLKWNALEEYYNQYMNDNTEESVKNGLISIMYNLQRQIYLSNQAILRHESENYNGRFYILRQDFVYDNEVLMWKVMDYCRNNSIMLETYFSIFGYRVERLWLNNYNAWLNSNPFEKPINKDDYTIKHTRWLNQARMYADEFAQKECTKLAV